MFEFSNYVGEWLSRIRSGLYPCLVKAECGTRVAVFEVHNQTEQWRASNLGGEADVISGFTERLSPGDTMWDIGANIGVYSIFAARAGANVVAFEPDPAFATHLTENVRLNNISSSVEIKQLALGDEAGSEVLYTMGTSGRSPTLAPKEEREAINVEVERGDKIDATPPDVLKLDIEGAEVRALSGLSGLLEEIETVLVEVHPERITEFGDEVDDVYDILGQAGLEKTSTYERDDQNLLLFTR